ncbi:hypothetical protein Emag_003269 [Eimeria magna]
MITHEQTLGGPLGAPRLLRLRALQLSACPRCTYTAASRRDSETAFARQRESNPVPVGDLSASDGSRERDPHLLRSSAAARVTAARCTDTPRLPRGPPPLTHTGPPCAIQDHSASGGRWLHARGAPRLWTGNSAGGPRWAHSGAPQKNEAAETRTQTLMPAKTPEGPQTLMEAEALELRAQTEQGLRLPGFARSAAVGVLWVFAGGSLGARPLSRDAAATATTELVYLLHPEALQSEPGAQEIEELKGEGMLRQLSRHRAAQTLLGYIHSIRPAAHHLLKEAKELDLAAAELLQCEFAEAFVDASVHTPRGPKPHAKGGPPSVAGAAAAAAGQQQQAPPIIQGGGPQGLQPRKPGLAGVAAALSACRQRRSEKYSSILV